MASEQTQRRGDQVAAEAAAGPEDQLGLGEIDLVLEGIRDREVGTIQGVRRKACYQSQAQVGKVEADRSVAHTAGKSLVETGVAEDNREEFVEHLGAVAKAHEEEGLVRSLVPHRVLDQGPVATCSICPPR